MSEKLYACGSRAAFRGTPEECPVIKIRAGKKVCGDGDNCDAEPVYVVSAADYEAQQAAIAAAEEVLTAIEEMGKLGGCWYEWEIDGEIIPVAANVKDALARLRAAKEAEDGNR